MNQRYILAIHELGEIEEKYNVYFFAQGGSYGSANLYMHDNKTGEDFPVKDIMSFLDTKETSE